MTITRRDLFFRTVTIASGTALSDEVDLGEGVLAGIIMPDAWTAADLTFQGAMESGGSFKDVYDDTGSELTVTTDAAHYITVDPSTLVGAEFLKVRSGTSSAAVNQAAERVLTLALKVS